MIEFGGKKRSYVVVATVLAPINETFEIESAFGEAHAAQQAKEKCEQAGWKYMSTDDILQRGDA